MFQQRHFEALATLMQDACPAAHWDPNKRAQWEVIRNRMVELFQCDNHLFKADRFIGACEPGANVRAKSHKRVA
jgi:hypothetical protein